MFYIQGLFSPNLENQVHPYLSSGELAKQIFIYSAINYRQIIYGVGNNFLLVVELLLHN